MEHKPPSTYILREMVDVDIPESISWFPQTLGWKIVAVVLVAILLVVIAKLVKHWWKNRYRGEALQAIQQVNVLEPKAEYQLFLVIKAVLRYREKEAAALYGVDFLTTLDRMNPGSPVWAPNDHCHVDEHLGMQWMESIVNPKSTLTPEQKQALVSELKQWILHHDSGDAHVTC
ncbi:DUF4381 domain-containing protein [Vibrio nomapromontoriensis]|uniref:DUF4381 domain-containing protein n=1 Tax=Vibrio nomapromontoriensis TaxID=2910246 RepID=UPI003D0B8A66